MCKELEEIEKKIKEYSEKLAKLAHTLQFEPTVKSERDDIEVAIKCYRDEVVFQSQLKKTYLRNLELEKIKNEEREEVKKIAKNMLKKGMMIKDIVYITELTEEQILNLK